MSSNNLDKYEYLTGEDLGLKPSTIEQTKFEYSPLSKIFNKGLNKDDKKEGLFKRLKNIEYKNEKQLKAIEDKNEKQLDTNSKSLKSISYFSQSSTKAKELFGKIKKEKNDIDPEKFVSVKTDGTILNFNKFKISLDLASGIYRNKKLLKDTENEQKEIKILLNKLRKYNPTKLKNLNVKEETLSSAEKLLNNRHEVIDAFKTGIFPYIDGLQIKEEEEEEEDDTKKFVKYIENGTKGINYNLFEHYFNFVVPSTLAKYLNETKNKNKNNELVEEIKKRWSNLKDEAEKMSEDEKETEKPDKLLKIVKENQKQGGLGIKF